MENETPDMGGIPQYLAPEYILSEGYGLMPNMVTFDDRLSMGARLLYCYLNSLSASEGKCFPKNKRIAEKFKVTTRQVSRWLSELMNYEYVFVSFSDQYTQTGKRTILLYYRQDRTKMSRGVDKNVQGGRHFATEKTGAIINTNNINTNNISNTSETTQNPDVLTVYQTYLNRMVLNPKTHNAPTLHAAQIKCRLTPKRENKIATRLKEFSVDDLVKAIENISQSDWHTGGNNRHWIAKLEWIMDSTERVEEWANTTPHKTKERVLQI